MNGSTVLLPKELPSKVAKNQCRLPIQYRATFNRLGDLQLVVILVVHYVIPKSGDLCHFMCMGVTHLWSEILDELYPQLFRLRTLPW